MRVVLLILGLLVFGIPSKAQVNGEFEEWSSSGDYEDPDNWITFNFMSFFGDSLSCLKSDKAFSGKYCAHLRTYYSAFASDTLPSILLQTEACSSKPNSFRYAYKHQSPGMDTAIISVEFYKGNTNDPSNLVGYADGDMPKNKGWQKVAVPITWTGLETPDTAVISIITGSDFGSEVDIDDISFSAFGVAITKVSKNPGKVWFAADGMLHSAEFESKTAVYELFNSSGQRICSGTFINGQAAETLALTKGIYVYRITSDGAITAGKILKH